MSRYLLVILFAYLLGSIPFGYLIVRARQGADVRGAGSGGTGATNVSRQAGKAAGVITLLLDALKGSVAVLVARWALGTAVLGGPALPSAAAWVVSGAAVAVILGHCFPAWLGFRGGKGVATGLGVFLVLAPIAVALAAVVFLLIVIVTRYVSLASIAAAMLIPFLIWLEAATVHPVPNLRQLLAAVSAGAALIVFAHRGNIGRLAAGTENKFK
ncbi:MAG: acyl phosphate:glycerol-3-phosphate acyltransferase [Blastocatellia bacterium]|jgi:glycerol-3-phosphate acyltransferase PlsY|nr:acyl phosphate:glycerol-3-phosphate acyltransferase [Blastocatellia bacterium]